MLKTILSLACLLAAAPAALAQGVGIGTTTPDAAAALDIRSATNATGLLIPRLTAAQRTAIANAPQGLLVYQTDVPEGFWYFAGSPAAWVLLNPNGDNLGNHTAAQNLNMQGFAVVGSGADLGANVGLGVRADGGLNLAQNTNANLLLGYQAGAGLAASSGFSNQVVGYQAGQSLTTGAANYLSGHQAGAALTGGNYNHFVGYHAGQYATGGSNNQFEGYEAGLFNTTGYQNYFAGYQAGLANSTGYRNLFAGYRAGQSNATGVLNTFVGSNAGWSSALGTNGTGSYNTVLGAGAVLLSPTLTNATAIGYAARVSQSNSLVLGGTGANAVWVGVGLTAPATELDVNGVVMARNRFVLAPQNGSSPTTYPIWAMDNSGSDFRLFQQPTLTTSGTTFVTVKNASGRVGIGNGADPQSTLEVKGTLALTPILGLVGGASAALGTLLSASSASLLGLTPQAGATHYALPAASSCPGRIYLIRNNSFSVNLTLTSLGGLIFDGALQNGFSSTSLNASPGEYDHKTIWLVSDGQNWLLSGFGHQY